MSIAPHVIVLFERLNWRPTYDNVSVRSSNLYQSHTAMISPACVNLWPYKLCKCGHGWSKLTYTISTPVLNAKCINIFIIFLVLLIHSESWSRCRHIRHGHFTYRLTTFERSLMRYNIKVDVIAVSRAKFRPKLAFASACEKIQIRSRSKLYTVITVNWPSVTSATHVSYFRLCIGYGSIGYTWIEQVSDLREYTGPL